MSILQHKKNVTPSPFSQLLSLKLYWKHDEFWHKRRHRFMLTESRKSYASKNFQLDTKIMHVQMLYWHDNESLQPIFFICRNMNNTSFSVNILYTFLRWNIKRGYLDCNLDERWNENRNSFQLVRSVTLVIYVVTCKQS